MEATDWELLERSQSGDTQAFDMLVMRHSEGLFRTALGMVANHSDAQDVVQETFFAAYQQRKNFQQRSAVRTWLVGILIRQAALHHRKKYQRNQAPIDQENLAAIADERPQTLSSNTRTEAKLDIAELLKKLSPEHREVIVLRELENLSYEAIAELLAVPRGTIESRLFRARQLLRELVSRHE